jgi:raffinose/stachyose/melibiose transport system permease protein
MIRPKKIIAEFFLLVLVLVWLFPVLWITLLSLKSNLEIFNYPLRLPNPPKFQNYLTAWNKISFPVLMKNTTVIAFFTLLVGTSFTFLSSFAIARFRLSEKLQNLVFLFFISGIFLPVFVLLFPLFLITAKLGLANTHTALVLSYAGGCASMNSLIFVGAMKGVPQSLEEAAVLDGCGVLRIIVNVYVPVLKPAIATVMLLHFLGIWNEFPIVSILINSTSKFTISLAASFFRGMYSTDYATLAAAVLIVTIPQIIIFVAFQRYVIAGVTAGAIKG